MSTNSFELWGCVLALDRRELIFSHYLWGGRAWKCVNISGFVFYPTSCNHGVEKGSPLLKTSGVWIRVRKRKVTHKGSDAFCRYLECCVAPGWSVSIFACKSLQICRFLLLIMMVLLFVFSSHCCLLYIVLMFAFCLSHQRERGEASSLWFSF